MMSKNKFGVVVMALIALVAMASTAGANACAPGALGEPCCNGECQPTMDLPGLPYASDDIKALACRPSNKGDRCLPVHAQAGFQECGHLGMPCCSSGTACYPPSDSAGENANVTYTCQERGGKSKCLPSKEPAAECIVVPGFPEAEVIAGSGWAIYTSFYPNGLGEEPVRLTPTDNATEVCQQKCAEYAADLAVAFPDSILVCFTIVTTCDAATSPDGCNAGVGGTARDWAGFGCELAGFDTCPATFVPFALSFEGITLQGFTQYCDGCTPVEATVPS